MIRMEIENAQMKQEMETRQEYTNLLEEKIDNLIKCI